VQGSSSGYHYGHLYGYFQGDGGSFVPYKPFKEGENIYFTRSKDNAFVYLIHEGWPFPSLTTNCVKPRDGSEIRMLGVQEPVNWHLDGDSLVIEMPASFNDKIPCEHAYCFKIEQI